MYDAGRFVFRRLVQDQIIRRVRGDMYRGRKQKFLYPVCREPRAIDHGAAGEGLSISLDPVALCRLTDAQHPSIEAELRAVCRCVFTGGNAQRPRVDRPGCGCVQGGSDTFRKNRLHLSGFLAGEQPQPGHAHGKAVFILLFQHRVGFLTIAHHQRAAAGKGDVQFPAERVKTGVGPHSHFRLQRTGLMVIAGVDDSCIGAGDAGTDILPRLQKRDMQFPAAEIPRCKAAQQTAADDDNIKIPHQNTSMISPGRSSV